MEWYNRLEIDLENGRECDDYEMPEAPMILPRAYFRINLTHTINFGTRIHLRKRLSITKYDYDVMRATRAAFEGMLNIKREDWDHIESWSPDIGPEGPLPWRIDIDHLPDMVKDLLREMFAGPNGFIEQRLRQLTA